VAVDRACGVSAALSAQFVTLIRGVNVGGRAVLPMAGLREMLGAMGLRDVRTVGQSGNVAFRVAEPINPVDLDAAVGAAILARFGLSVSCLTRTEGELRAALAANPLAALVTDGRKMQGIFLSADPDPELLARHDPVALDPERIARADRVIYQWCPDGILAAPAVVPFVERRLKVRATARNWNTLRKIEAILDR